MTRSYLLTLVGVTLLVIGCGQSPPEQTASTEKASEATRGRHRIRGSAPPREPETTRIADVDIPMLDIAVLDREATPFEAGRDPFRYGPAPAPPPPPPKTPEPRPEPASVVSRPKEPVKPVAPPFTHDYLGSFGSAGLRIAVFEDGEGTIINAFEGEVLEGKFKVLKIGYESVDIEFVGFPDTPAERRQIGG